MKKILLLSNAQSILPSQLGVKLEAEGFCVNHPAHEMHEWLSEIDAHQPDLILMELLEDNMLELCRLCHRLRQESHTESIPILLLGGPSVNGNGNALNALLEGLQAGANDYLQTPFGMPELLSKIHTALRMKNLVERSQVLANQLNSVNEELYQRNIQVEKELHIARQLQQSLLPPAIPQPEDDSAPIFTKIHYQDDKIRISGIYLPCDALGGDLYDVIKFPDEALGISITDVSGHGVPAGFITAIFKTSLYRITHQQTDPSVVLYHLNNELFDIVKTGDYVTSIYLRIDPQTMQLDCAGAGHPYPFYYCAKEHAIHRLKKNGTPLVWVRDIEYPLDSIQLSPGDKVFLITDGISELKNPAGEMYGEDRVTNHLLEAIEAGAPYLTDELIGNLSDYTEGAPLEDDISMVLIEAL